MIARAVSEYQLLKSCTHDRDENYSKIYLESKLKEGKGYKLTLINTPEMARQAGLICPLFLQYVDEKLMADKLFILELIDVPKILDFASKEIKEDHKMKALVFLISKKSLFTLTDKSKNVLPIQIDKLSPEQKALFIRQITESIKNDIPAEKSAPQ